MHFARMRRSRKGQPCGSSKLNAAEFRCWRPFLGQQRFVWRGLRTRMVKNLKRFEKAWFPVS
jgi:hypothetical protein